MRLRILLMCFLFLFEIESESRSQTIVRISISDGETEKYLFVNEKIEGMYNTKGRLVKLSEEDIVRQKVFLRQAERLITYGINIKYPEVVSEDACIIADILSSYDQNEILSFSHPIKSGKRITINDINKYYTYLNARVDYVFSIDIVVQNHLITQFTYKYIPNLTDEIVSDTCKFMYDKRGRVTKSTRFNGQLKETRSISYSLKR